MQTLCTFPVAVPNRRIVAAMLAVCWTVTWRCQLSDNPVLAEDGDSDSALPAVGDSARDFELSGPGDVTVKLSELTSQGPVIVLVLRGWPGYQCPICSRQVGQFIGSSDEIAATGANVVLIYPGPADGLSEHADEFMSGTTLPDGFHFVIDPDYEFTNDWHLRWDAPQETAYPSTFVINGDNEITFAKISMSHGGRASTAEVLEVLAE